MHLGFIRVQNFRNLQDLSFALKRGLNVIVGENNIGKTNLLDAVRWALGIQSVGRDAAVLLDKDDRHHAPDGTVTDAPIRVTLQFRGLTSDERVGFLDILNYNAAAPEKSTATIHSEWTYSESRARWSFRRWGGDRKNTEGTVTDELLQALPLTYLEALRDAERELAPGRRSRLARFLDTTANAKDREDVTKIGAESNQALAATDLVKRAEAAVVGVLALASNTDLMRQAAIRPAPTDFARLVQTLRVLLKPLGGGDQDDLLEGLDSNGLGYNNLIYIATVLAELQARSDSGARILVVEEPEAHLHPQLQTLLATHLATQADKVQTILTTHSPTIAAHVAPRHLAVMHRDNAGTRRIVRIDACGLTDPQERQLQRILDVTRATLLFAQGVILVEGISECLLIPALASRLGIDLAQRAIAVVPVGGVDFASIGRLFGDDKTSAPLAIVTDADPPVDNGDKHWREHTPRRDLATNKPERCARAKDVVERYGGSSTVHVEISDVTLEYDLAAASPDNALCLFDAWSSCYASKPSRLKRSSLEELTTADERALLLWRAVCRASPQHGKAELAHALAERLRDATAPAFTVPAYIARSIRHAARAAQL